MPILLYLCSMFPLIIIVVLILAAWRGWYRGLLHQLASLMGLAFGIVFSRIFCADVSAWLVEHCPHLGEGIFPEYTYSMISVALVFGAVYLLFSLLATVLNSALSILHLGALNSIAGAVFSILKWVLMISVALNLWLSINPDSKLADYCDDGDGNIVELVMAVAPALTGTESPDDLEHRRRQEEAKTICLNQTLMTLDNHRLTKYA